MQPKDEGPRAARPSLLTPAQQAEAERNRILSTLESGRAAGPAVPRRSRVALWSAGLALALAAGAVFWLSFDDAPALAVTMAADAGTAPPASAQEPPGAAAVASETVAPAAAAPLTATINEVPVAAALPPPQPSLGDMLAGGVTPAPASGHEVLSHALERPAAVAPAPPKSRPRLAQAAAVKPVSTAVSKPDGKAAPTATAATTAAQESDITLLSALVAHTQVADVVEVPPKLRPSLKEQLAQCQKFAHAKAAACRARVCDGRSKTGACKVPR